jgi:hypothetical protein
VLITGFAIPALAHGGSEDYQTQPPSEEGWEAMYEACLNGDWEGMLVEMEQFFTDMPCFGAANTGPDDGSQTPGPGWDGMMGEGWYGQTGGGYAGGYGGHMGGGMMGGWGGMMGW